MKKTTLSKPKSPKSKTSMKKLHLKAKKSKHLEESNEEINFSKKLANCSLKDTTKTTDVGAAGDFAYGSKLEVPEIKTLDFKKNMNSRKVHASSIEVSNDKVKDFSTDTNSGGFGAIELNETPTFSNASSGSEWASWTPSKIKIDFKPTEEDEKLYDKCTKLWEYIQSVEELENMAAVPENVKKGRSKKDIPFSYEDVEKLKEEDNEQDNNMLSFPATMMIASLDPGLLESSFTEKVTCSEKDETHYYRLKKSEDTQKICKEMDEFDKTHSKSYSPPRLLPELKRESFGSPIAD